MTPAILRQLETIRCGLFPTHHAGQVSVAATCLQEN